ncbi:MAG: DNA internalization-related competence protein ComEC/Rec2 [Thermodesulfovibrionales bacterium]|nr:DNA internalization-related competence protein ComEC/Rec2 [Thermodesulfovibrionales bacterium]
MPFLSFLSGAAACFAFEFFPYTTLVSSGLAVFLLLRGEKFLLIGLAAIGLLYAVVSRPYPMDFPQKTEAEITGVFTSSPVEAIEGFSQEFKIKSALEAGTGKPLAIKGRGLNIYSEREFEHGRRYRLKIRLRTPGEAANPGDYSRPSAALMEALEEGDLSFIESARARINSYISSRFDRDSAALLMAVTTGQRANMSRGLSEAFASTGLVHLLSISGTHFGLFSILLFFIFRLLLNSLPYGILERLTAYVTPRQAAAVMSLPFMLFYLGISGGSIPATRSFIMITLFLIGIVIGKKRYWLNALLLAAVIIVLWEPAAMLELSFILSFSAVLFIGFFVAERSERTGLRQYPVNVVLVSLAATLGSAPIAAYYFHRISLISVFSNLIVTPVVGFLLVPMSLSASFSYLLTDTFLAPPVVGAVSNFSISLVRLLASIPFAEIKIPAFPAYILLFYYACFLIYQVLPVLKERTVPGMRPGFLLLPFVLILAYSVYAAAQPKNLTAAFLNAGEGDSSVIELPDGKTIVIDTGKSGRQAAAYLGWRGIRDIDALVLTHAHADHAGGLQYILSRFGVKELWDNGQTPYPEGIPEGITQRHLKRGDFIEEAGYKIHVFHPYEGFYTLWGSSDIEKNNSSVVLKVEGKRSFLYAGDIETEAQDDIAHLGGLLKSEVLKVPHHGLKSSMHQGFLNAVSPQIAVITSKKSYPGLKEALKCSVYLTGTDGAVRIEDKDEGLEARLYKDFTLKKTEGDFKEEIRNIKRLFVVW